VYVLCDGLSGGALHRETLSVKFKGKSIAELLDTTRGRLPLLENMPQIQQKLQTLLDVVWVISSWPVSDDPLRR